MVRAFTVHTRSCKGIKKNKKKLQDIDGILGNLENEDDEE